jgi:hypothetical protein
MTRPGQRDYSKIKLTRHAIERFVERFGADSATAEDELRAILARTRRLGRNPANGAIAVLGARGQRILVAILQKSVCLTVLTWPLFAPRLAEFGKKRLAKKPQRMLNRLIDPEFGQKMEIIPKIE